MSKKFFKIPKPTRKLIFLAYSDIHHHIYNQFNQDNKRLKVTLDFEKHIFNIAKKKRCPIIFTGDLLHLEKAVPNELLDYILPHYKELNDTGVMWYGISGNHDQSSINIRSKQSPSYVRTLSKVFSNMFCIDFTELKYPKADLSIFGIPYLTNDEGLLDELKLMLKQSNKESRRILLLHTTLPETQDTNGRIIQTNTIGKTIMKRIRKFDLVLVGHVHKPMKLAKNIYQLGATNQQRKTDKECKLGYWEIYDDLSIEFRPMDNPRFIELEEGEKIPDDKHFYYYKLPENKGVSKSNIETKNFSNITNKTKLAKSYIKESGIKSKTKKEKLIEILKSEE